MKIILISECDKQCKKKRKKKKPKAKITIGPVMTKEKGDK